MIGCPACAGVLRSEPSREERFICSVGHAFSLEDVYEAKEQELERAQWSVIALSNHLQMILRVLAASSEPDAPGHQAIRQRLEQVKAQIENMHRMIEATDCVPRNGTELGIPVQRASDGHE
jgi:hypothetical protein